MFDDIFNQHERGGQTPADSKDRAMHIASRGKNNVNYVNFYTLLWYHTKANTAE